MNIHDLPNELLDEIFAHVIPEINSEAVIPINTVCKRWNRPFMTHTLWNKRLPQNIDLQTKFPKLTTFGFSPVNHCKDLSFFKGHAFLQELRMYHTGLTASVLDCPRLTILHLYVSPRLFFKDENLEIFFCLLPRLEDLEINVFSDGELGPRLIDGYNQKLASILQNRPMEKLKLKRLAPSIEYVDFMLFCRLFETSSLDHCKIIQEFIPGQICQFLGLFPKLRSFEYEHSSHDFFNEGVFDHVTRLKVMLGQDTLSCSLLLKQYPNVESLEEVDEWSMVFDLKVPTRLTHLSMSFIGTVQPRFFPHLKILEWRFDLSQFNYVMQELGVHCPHLTSIKMHRTNETNVCIVPKLDNIVFPLLVELEFHDGPFKV